MNTALNSQQPKRKEIKMVKIHFFQFSTKKSWKNKQRVIKYKANTMEV